MCCDFQAERREGKLNLLYSFSLLLYYGGTPAKLYLRPAYARDFLIDRKEKDVTRIEELEAQVEKLTSQLAATEKLRVGEKADMARYIGHIVDEVTKESGPVDLGKIALERKRYAPVRQQFDYIEWYLQKLKSKLYAEHLPTTN